VCGSGLQAIELGAQSIRNGSKIVIVGGQENMSLSPHVYMNSRAGHKMGDVSLKDSMITDGLWCAFNDYHMGMTAENIASMFAITRAEQDAFAANSQRKAAAAQAAGRFHLQTVPIETGKSTFATDEYIKVDVNEGKMAKLKTPFKESGTVTPANASGINDGAAMCMLMSYGKAKELGLEPFGSIRGFAIAGVDPQVMGTGPIPASKECLKRAGWSVDDLDLIEANEAFAAQAICVTKELGLDPSKVNVNGGAIAIGHPIGASGCRIAVDLLHEMKRSRRQRGLATLCIGGGQGIAMCFERLVLSPL